MDKAREAVMEAGPAGVRALDEREGDVRGPDCARNESEFRAAFEHAGTGMAIAALDGRWLYVNRAFCELTGYSAAQLRRRGRPSITYPDDAAGDAVELQRLLAGESAVSRREKRLVHRDGHPIWVLETVTLSRDREGRPRRRIVEVSDLTARRLTESRLERANRALRVMSACSRALAEATDEPRLLQQLCNIAVEAGGYLMAWVGIPTGDPLRPVRAAAHAGFGEDGPMRGVAAWSADGRYRGFMGEVIREAALHISRDILNDPAHASRRARAVQRGFQSSIGLPLTDGQGSVMGALAIYAREPDAFDREEIALLRELASDIASGIESLRTRIARMAAERAAREIEQRFALTFDQASVGMILCGLDGRYVHVNQHFAEMLGYAREEIIGRPFDSFAHPGEDCTLASIADRLVHGDMPRIEGEYRFVRGDGPVVLANRTLSLARGPGGEPLYIVGVVEDITRRRQREAHYRAMFENAGVGITRVDLEGVLVDANQKFLDMLGYGAAELIGRHVREITHPDDRDQGVRYRDQLARGESRSASGEKRFIRRDGAVIWARRTMSTVVDAAGRAQYVISVVEDITERKRAEERHRATFENAPVGIMHTDIADDRVLRANPRLCEMLGYAPDEITRMKTDDLLHPEFVGTDQGKYRERMLAGEVDRFASERLYRRKDGSDLWVNRTVSLVRDASGKPLYFIRIIEDINERKLAASRQAMEHAVARVLSESATVEEAMPLLIRILCETLGWVCGNYWQWDRRAQLLRRERFWHLEDEAVAGFVAYSRGIDITAPHWHGGAPPGGWAGGVVRRVWQSGAPVWFPDVAVRGDFRRGELAARAGLHSVVGFPVLADGLPLGVMEFYGRAIKEPDEALLRSVRALGSQIGQFIQRKDTERALLESEEQFRQLANNIPQAFWITDVDQRRTLYLSPAAATLLGHPLGEILRGARLLVKAVHPEDRARVHAARRRAANGGYDETYRVVRADGAIRWVRDRAFPVRDASGAVYRIAGIAEDITERKHAEERLMHLAHYDVLTNLPNRVLFYDRLRQALAQARRNDWIVGVMLIDVDRFKNVNDTLGHAVGDRLLQQVSERLKAAVRAGDTVGRLGGDEFAIVLSNLASAQDGNLVAQKVLASFHDPFRLDAGAEIYVTGSIGITLFPDDTTDQDILIKNADAAMYQAKDAGRNSYRFYKPEMNARASRLLSLESSLRRALERQEFLLHYQPKVSAATHEIVGVEALLRWRHPERGLVAPGEFMPVLEETGLITRAGEWVIGAVCAQIAEWRREGCDPVPVAINLSARQFTDRDLGHLIQGRIEAHGIAPQLIEFEITESSIMTNIEESTRALEFLASLGVGLSIDDFGTGYSSLGYLKRFPLDALKIDRSFVRDITTSVDDATITRAVISMAHSLGLKVIAEGVETAEQIAFLAEHGCDELQGYYFARPLPAAECREWLTRRRDRAGEKAGRAEPAGPC